MDIQKRVKQYLDKNGGWPEHEVKIGPATCKPDCQEDHAYAKTIKTTCGMAHCNHEHGWVWVFERPCVELDKAYSERLKQDGR